MADRYVPTIDQARSLHRQMIRIRLFEEHAGALAEAGKIPGFIHLYVGQEAIAVGVADNLRTGDAVTSHHRGHGHAIAMGADLRAMYSELLGRRTGYCKGLSGSMHVSDSSIGMLGANGIVGAGIPHALGAAFHARYRGNDSVAVAFFGDGATNIGVFHESANLAAVLGLPVIFVCENNGYAEFSPQSSQSLIADVADRAASYGMPGEVVDGMDVCAVHAAAQRAIARAREGDGPMLLEAKTYRYYDHQGVKGLRKSYRSEEEVEQWRNRDPISSFEAWLDTEALLDHGEAASVWAEVAEEVQSAASFADAQPEPDAADLMAYVYAGG